MAVLAITNVLTYHAESIGDMEALGSTTGITADTVAMIAPSWYYPVTISSTTSTWAVATGYQTTGAAGSQPQQFASTQQFTLTPPTTNSLVATLGTLDTNGQNMKVIVKVTGVDDALDTNFIAYTYEQVFYRQTGTVSSVGVFDNQTNSTGVAEFTGNVSFNVTAVGDDIRLRVSNSSSTATYSLNTAYFWTIQEGGYA